MIFKMAYDDLKRRVQNAAPCKVVTLTRKSLWPYGTLFLVVEGETVTALFGDGSMKVSAHQIAELVQLAAGR